MVDDEVKRLRYHSQKLTKMLEKANDDIIRDMNQLEKKIEKIQERLTEIEGRLKERKT